MRWYVLGIVLGLWLCSTRAEARMIQHHDLRSLFVMAEVVVDVQKVAVHPQGQWHRYTEFRVQKVHQGTVQVGEIITVSGPSTYAFAGMGQASSQQDVPDRLTLFLARTDSNTPSNVDWYIVPSGVRMIHNGKAKRFEQMDNPGPYVPVPQGPDPLDVLLLPGGDAELTDKQLSTELANAKRRADKVRAALAEPNKKLATKRLVALLGPDPRTRRHGVSLVWPFYSDDAARVMLDRLGEIGDITAVLQGVGRVRGGMPWRRWTKRPKDMALVVAAADNGRPLAERLTALEILIEDDYRVSEATTVPTIGLVSDPEPRIRASAAQLLRRRKGEVVDTAIKRAWAKEKHHAAQHALLRVAHRRNIANDLITKDRPSLVVTARRDYDLIDAGWVSFADDWRIESAKVEVTGNGQTRTVDLGNNPLPAWSSTHDAGFRARMTFDPPLKHGTYKVALTLTLQTTGTKVKATRTFDLAAWTIGIPANPDAAPVEPGPAAPPTTVELIQPKPSASTSCACAIVGSRHAPHWWQLLAAVPLALLLRRRSCDQSWP